MNRRELLASVATAASSVGLSVESIEGAPDRPILLVIRPQTPLKTKTLHQIRMALEPLEKRLGIPIVVVPHGLTVEAVYHPKQKETK